MTTDASRKRDLVRAYKERKPQRGVYVVTCAATDGRWAASTANLDKQQNMTWFTLKMGSHTNREMQAAWNAHGEESFSYEILDELGDDVTDPVIIRAELKAMEELWREKLADG